MMKTSLLLFCLILCWDSVVVEVLCGDESKCGYNTDLTFFFFYVSGFVYFSTNVSKHKFLIF